MNELINFKNKTYLTLSNIYTKLRIYEIYVINLIFISLIVWRSFYLRHINNIWAETGKFSFPEIISSGFMSIFYPLQGQLNLISNFVNYISFSINPFYFPAISTIFTICIIVLILNFIRHQSVTLKYKTILAISCLLVPISPEVYGLSLHLHFWIAIPLILLIFWDNNSILNWKLNFSYLLFGLSSIFSIIITPLLLLKGYQYPKFYKNNKLTYLIIILTSFVQALITTTYKYPSESSIYNTGLKSIIKNLENSYQGMLDLVYLFAKKFFGYYISSNDNLAIYLGFILLLFILFFLITNIKNTKYLNLGYFLLVSIFLSIYRIPIDMLHPINSGPRYFFLPYIITT